MNAYPTINPFKTIHLPTLLGVCLFLAYLSPAYCIDSVRIDGKTSLFTVFDQSIPIVTTKYAAWGKNWAWADVKATPTAPASLDYKGQVGKLDVDFSSTIKLGDNRADWQYRWHKKLDHPDATGVGIDFKLKLKSPTFNNVPAATPELLPGNAGWRWQVPDGQTIEVKFSPAPAKVFFEKGQKNFIRMLFFTGVAQGDFDITMSVNISGKKVKMLNAVTEDYGKTAQPQDWHKNILANTASPVDLSFLNRNDIPAGKHGFVKAQGDSLVFADGTPVKFWGGNIMAYSLFKSSDNDIKTHAKRLAQLGFNLIRLHHHDSKWVMPNVFKNPGLDTQHLSEDALKKLDWWIHCLKEQGIYIWMDLHVGRSFTKNDGIDYFEELKKGEGKGFNYLNDSIQNQMQRFNEAYLNHVNPFTKLAYKNDPAIIALLITNENDINKHFGNLFLPNKGAPEHNKLFNADLKQFVAKTGLSKEKVWQIWEPGQSKFFTADVEHRFNQKMIKHLRDLGSKSMIATTNSWGEMALNGLPSLSDGDLIDAHSYGNAEELNFNPRYNPSFIAWLGAAQVAGKPLSVTEWNANSLEITDRFTMPVYLASIAALQGWDAMMLYGYSQVNLNGPSKPSNFSAYNDPALIGLMPAAALLYRQGQVAPAKQHFALALDENNFYSVKQDPSTSKSIRTLLETSRFSIVIPQTKALPWLSAPPQTSAMTVVTDANKDFIPAGQNYVQSDTGELKRDWQKGIHTTNAPQAQIASGWLGGETIKLDEVSFELTTKKAVVAVQSLDNKPLKSSKEIFITALARSKPGKNSNGFMSEPVEGEITITAPAKLTLYPITETGKRGIPVPTTYNKGKYHIKLNQAHWYILS